MFPIYSKVNKLYQIRDIYVMVRYNTDKGVGYFESKRRSN